MTVPPNPQPGAPTIPGAAPAPAKRARFLHPPQPKVIALQDPVEFDGQEFSSVTVSPITIGTYRDHINRGGQSDALSLPMFHDQNGKHVPVEVLSTLMMRDANAILEACNDFLNGPSRDSAEPRPPGSPNGGTSPSA